MRIWDRGRLRHSVGIETKGGRFTPLIPKGARLPASVTETFTTADPDQESIQLRPFQGDKPLASLNQQLGHFEVTEIPPANPGEPLIYVTFHVDAKGKLTITARDEGNDEDLPVLRR
jgi:molecular chaperone DnaK